jgi:ferredoxin
MEQKVGDLNVRIERDSCIGSGNCIKIASGLFVLDDQGLVAFRSSPEDPGAERVVDACQVCPVEALVVTDAQGKQIVP